MSDDKKVNKIVMPGKVSHDKDELFFYTHQATLLIYGRRSEPGKYGIMGLLGFSSVITSFCFKTPAKEQKNHPYLLFIEEHINKCRFKIQDEELSLGELIDASPISISDSSLRCDRPHVLEITFVSHLSYSAAYLLIEFDRFIAKCVIAAKKSVLTVDDMNLRIKKANRIMRSLFSQVNNWDGEQKSITKSVQE